MKRKCEIFTLITIAVVLCDQFSKYIISERMYVGQSIKIIGSFFRITYVRNPYAAFGIQVGPPIVMMILTSIATLLLVFYFFRLRERGFLLYIGLAMIIGGAIGNLTDRFRLHEVIDFIEVGVKKFIWPIFNIADSFVTIGIVLIIGVWIFGKQREEKK